MWGTRYNLAPAEGWHSRTNNWLIDKFEKQMTFVEIFTQHKLTIYIKDKSIQLDLDNQKMKEIDLRQEEFDPTKDITKSEGSNNIFHKGLAKKIKNELNTLSGDPWYLRRKHDIKAFIPITNIKKDINHWLDFFQFLGGAKVNIYFNDNIEQHKDIKNGTPVWIARTNFNNIIWPVTSFNKEFKLL
ncbi:MAG: hypothetical protein RIA69_11475 [Cyclobacteriaceae bacterium]